MTDTSAPVSIKNLKLVSGSRMNNRLLTGSARFAASTGARRRFPSSARTTSYTKVGSGARHRRIYNGTGRGHISFGWCSNYGNRNRGCRDCVNAIRNGIVGSLSVLQHRQELTRFPLVAVIPKVRYPWLRRVLLQGLY